MDRITSDKDVDCILNIPWIPYKIFTDSYELVNEGTKCQCLWFKNEMMWYSRWANKRV